MSLRLKIQDEMLEKKVNSLISMRLRVAFGLSVFLLVLYLGYAFLLGAPDKISAAPVSGELSLIVMISILVVIFGVCVAGIYTWWANTKLEPELKKIREKLNAK
jgi:uncharacterized membrane protein (DUF485 family)